MKNASTATIYDRVEILHFADGTQGKHVSVEVGLYGNRFVQPSLNYVRSWQDINPSITNVSFVYLNARCYNFIRA